MSIDVPDRAPVSGLTRGQGLRAWLLKVFLRVGVLPFLLVAAVVVFSVLSDQFLTTQNLINLVRQSVYLILVSMGQMLALATGGFDLSVGTIVALTSVVSASVMSTLGADGGSAAWAVLLGCGAGLAGRLGSWPRQRPGHRVGHVSPFIMTLGVQSIGLGVALALTGGVPVSGIPSAFGDLFGFGTLLGIPIPVMVTGVIVVAMYVLMTRTATGTHLLAVGGNAKAAALSGISTRRTLLLAYVLCSLLAAVSGLLLTARVNSRGGQPR